MNGAIKLILAAIGTVCLLGGVLLATGRLTSRIESNTESVKQMEPRVQMMRETLVELQTTQKYMQRQIDSFIQEQRTVNTQVLEWIRTSNNNP